MSEIILISVTGEDRPGLTADLTRVLAQYHVNILDIGQAVIHDMLSLGILISIPKESESAPILKDLLFTAHSLDVTLHFSPVDPERHRRWVEAQGKPRYIVTLLAEVITARHVNSVTQALREVELNIDIINRLTGRPDPSGASRAKACVEISVRGHPTDQGALKKQFMEIAAEGGVDIAFQEDNAFRKNRRLVCFDMDSTLIQAEVIDELAREAGVVDQVSAITESAMRGELDFSQSLRKRLALLKGLPEERLLTVKERIPLTEGAERLIKNLKRLGYKTAILSGGFTYFGRLLQEHLGVDYMYANELEIRDGKLTGNVIGDIVDGERKANLLKELARQEKINLQQVIAVGDGANDLPMLNIAGLGIAFHAKPLVRQGAKQSISTFGLDSILYIIGLGDRDIDASTD